MLSNNDQRELVQTVTQTVLERVTEQLKQMYPSIVDGIAQQIDQKYRAEIDGLKQQIANLQSSRPSSASFVNPTVSPGSGSSAQRINLRKIGYGYKKFNGWIYYMNNDMMDFLYKVREDGTCNTQLTDFTVKSIEGIKNGKLIIADDDWNEHVIDL